MHYLLMTNEDGNGIMNAKVQIIPEERAKGIIERLETFADCHEDDNGIYAYTMENICGTLIPLDIPIEEIDKLLNYSFEAEQKNYSDCMDDKDEEAMDNHIYHTLCNIQRWLKTLKKGYTRVEETLVYEKESQTIRQMPQNYLVADKRERAWISEPDLACNKSFALKVYTALFEHENKYGTGENLLKAVGF